GTSSRNTGSSTRSARPGFMAISPRPAAASSRSPAFATRPTGANRCRPGCSPLTWVRARARTPLRAKKLTEPLDVFAHIEGFVVHRRGAGVFQRLAPDPATEHRRDRYAGSSGGLHVP